MVPIASKVGLCTQRYIKDINRSSNVREEFKHGTTSLYAVMAVVYFQNIVNLSLSRLSCQVKPVQPICFRFTLFYRYIFFLKYKYDPCTFFFFYCLTQYLHKYKYVTLPTCVFVERFFNVNVYLMYM